MPPKRNAAHAWLMLTGLAALSVAATTLVWAQAEPATQSAQTQPATEGDDPDRMFDQMLQEMEESPAVAPRQRPEPEQRRRDAGRLTDPRVRGVHPRGDAAQPPKLRPEGRFVMQRRGHVVPAEPGPLHLFVFKSENLDQPEPPMLLMPCRLTQQIEDTAERYDYEAEFIITGQIFAYRGANYLLPSLVQRPRDDGNLQP